MAQNFLTDLEKLKVGSVDDNRQRQSIELQTFTISYPSADLSRIERVDTVTTVVYSDWVKYIALQEKLLKRAVDGELSIDVYLLDPELRSAIEDIAKMLRVIGHPDRKVDIQRLLDAGDYIQIARIFLSEGYGDPDLDVRNDYRASAVARIHGMDFTGKIAQMQIAKEERRLLETVAVQPPDPAVPSVPVSNSSASVSKDMELAVP